MPHSVVRLFHCRLSHWNVLNYFVFLGQGEMNNRKKIDCAARLLGRIEEFKKPTTRQSKLKQKLITKIRAQKKSYCHFLRPYHLSNIFFSSLCIFQSSSPKNRDVGWQIDVLLLFARRKTNLSTKVFVSSALLAPFTDLFFFTPIGHLHLQE